MRVGTLGGTVFFVFPALETRRSHAVTFSGEIDTEIARVVAEIDQIEASTVERLKQPPSNEVQRIELLGKLLLFDNQLSLNRNEACAF